MTERKGNVGNNGAVTSLEEEEECSRNGEERVTYDMTNIEKRTEALMVSPGPLAELPQIESHAFRQSRWHHHVSAKSNLGKRILARFLQLEKHDGCCEKHRTDRLWYDTELPDNFLSLPHELAVLRHNSFTGKWEYEAVAAMEQRVLQDNELHLNGHHIFSRTLFRDPRVGLGMTLCDAGSHVQVHSLIDVDGRRWSVSNSPTMTNGPAIDAHIHTGDLILGVNGEAFAKHYLSGSQEATLVKFAVMMIQESPDPVVLHIHRPQAAEDKQISTSFPLEGSETQGNFPHLIMSSPKVLTEHQGKMSAVHPFATALATRGLIECGVEEASITRRLAELIYHARQWDASMATEKDRRVPLTHQNFPGSRLQDRPLEPSHIAPPRALPLPGVRKALCVRILNTFEEGKNTAYTTWVFDVEGQREWYAPVRFYRDFLDLRAATLHLSPLVSRIPFPMSKWNLFGNRDGSEPGDEVCRKLERFLRVLCSIAYREKLDPRIVQIAVHVQSFLGCDMGAPAGDAARLDLYGHLPFAHNGENIRVLFLLKRRIQLQVHTVFLLDAVEQVVNRFVDHMRTKGLQTVVSKPVEESQSWGQLKKRSLHELKGIRVFLDEMQDLIIEGCMSEFTLISQRGEFSAFRSSMEMDEWRDYWDQLVRESVREMVEIEVYVSLRSVVSRLLVNGWRHDDTEIKFKMKELRDRPATFLQLPTDNQNWGSVSRILKEGVGRSTLPCVKLRAIVNAAKELTQIFSRVNLENSNEKNHPSSRESDDSHNPCSSHLGADVFLPIFIYCVVHANMERPCALCILLSTLCDRACRTGETGYYLSSFEAAIAHINEIDLSEYG